MARPEVKPSLTLHERVLRAVDEKILAHPFNTGVNSAMWGLSCPIRRSRRDVQYSSGTTAKEMFDETVNEPRDVSSTPESMFEELKVEAVESENQDRPLTAEEMFEGTIIVLRNPKDFKGQERKKWASLQPAWIRNWAITGEYFGSGSSEGQIAGRFGFTRQNIDQITKKHQSCISSWRSLPNANKGGKGEESKPQGLWNRRTELLDPESDLSRFIQDHENGEEFDKLSQKYGYKVDRYRTLLKDLDVEVTIPHKQNWLNKEFSGQFIRLEDPNLPIKEKRRILSNITRGLLEEHGKEELHVIGIRDLSIRAGLYIRLQDVKRIMPVLKKNKLIVHSIPVISHGKIIRNHHILPSGDIEKAVLALQNDPSIADLRVPTVIAYGKEASGKTPNTNTLQNGGKSNTYVRDSLVVGKNTKRFIKEGKIAFSDIVGEDCPGTLYVQRKRGIFVKTEEKEALRVYFAAVEQEIVQKLISSATD